MSSVSNLRFNHRASKAAFEAVNSKNTDSHDTMDFLQPRRPIKEPSPKDGEKNDVGHLVFTNKQDTEAEKFLHDFIVNQRWKRPKQNELPTYSEVIERANLDSNDIFEKKSISAGHVIDDFSQIVQPDDTVADEDDDFLIRARDFDRFNQGNPKIKSYPRKVITSIQQGVQLGSSTRSIKRQARLACKAEAKRARLAELKRLRLLKLSAVADKIERIKRTCGTGCSDLDTFCASEVSTQLTNPPNENGESADFNISSKTAQTLAAHLDSDEDWDPDKHSAILERLFNDNYDKAEDEYVTRPPSFSDMSDADSMYDYQFIENGTRKRKKQKKLSSDHITKKLCPVSGTTSYLKDKTADSKHSNSSGSSNEESAMEENRAFNLEERSIRKRRRIRSKPRLKHALKRVKASFDPTVNADYEAYFEKYYGLPCEDIIPGPTPDEDVFCRFHYREVPANDFGLSTEDILKASTRELNSWVPINQVTGYRTDQAEELDQRKFHSNKRIEKKSQVIPSLADPNVHWWPSTETVTETTLVKSKRKRSSKKRKNDSKTEEIIKSPKPAEPMQIESTAQQAKKASVRKFQGVQISQSRLAAAGITTKDLYRGRAKEA